MKIRILTMLLLISILLMGCVEPEQIEQIGIINARGLDALENDLLETTIVIYQFSSESDSISKSRSGKGYTVRSAMEDTEHTTSFRLSPGKIKVEMFGKEIVEKGIFPYLDTLTRDAQMSDMMFLTISDTTAKEILSIDENIMSKNVGQFLYELIKNETTDHNIPRKTLHDFFRIYYEVGQDNVLPIFEIYEEVPRQKAIAILQDDKLVGEIESENGILINLMNSTITRQIVEVNLPIEPFKEYIEKREKPSHSDVFHTAYRIEKGNSKTKVIDKEKLHFQTDTEIKMRLLEQSAGVLIRDEHVIKLLEDEVEKKLVSRFEDLLKKLQELNADPFGYGRYYRIQQKDGKLKEDEWREKFPHIKVDFKVKVEIIRHGIID